MDRSISAAWCVWVLDWDQDAVHTQLAEIYFARVGANAAPVPVPVSEPAPAPVPVPVRAAVAPTDPGLAAFRARADGTLSWAAYMAARTDADALARRILLQFLRVCRSLTGSDT
jgi:hypothetical protein